MGSLLRSLCSAEILGRPAGIRDSLAIATMQPTEIRSMANIDTVVPGLPARDRHVITGWTCHFLILGTYAFAAMGET